LSVIQLCLSLAPQEVCKLAQWEKVVSMQQMHAMQQFFLIAGYLRRGVATGCGIHDALSGGTTCYLSLEPLHFPLLFNVHFFNLSPSHSITFVLRSLARW